MSLWPLYHGNMHKKPTFSERSLEHALPLVAVVLTWWSVLAAESQRWPRTEAALTLQVTAG